MVKKKYTGECFKYQKYSPKQKKENLYSIQTAALWEQNLMDIVYMPTAKLKKQYLVVAKEYLLSWPEAKALTNATSKTVTKFL